MLMVLRGLTTVAFDMDFIIAEARRTGDIAHRSSRAADLPSLGGWLQATNPTIETAEEVRDRVLEAASFIPVSQLGATDDCGFAPFADDTSTARDIAFSKVRARVEG